jgi:hypothetical protein
MLRISAPRCEATDTSTSPDASVVRGHHNQEQSQMRFISTVIATTAFAVLSTGFASAAVSDPRFGAVLDSCPIADQTGCAAAVSEFVSTLPSDATDEIMALVRVLADQVNQPAMTAAACVELQQGIRAAGRAVSLPAARNEIAQIARELCDELDSPNGSISGGGGGSSGPDYEPIPVPSAL